MNNLETGSLFGCRLFYLPFEKLRSAETKFACFSGWKDTET
ncbi:hypothetical protein BAXH7_00359 [Bacillus amyloliquefaciens XH7]|nr:hypothetical protein BAMTA208_01740 [Bacillus amyloliquefaciens TA208]AEB61905.1 hypothetical protein LL3_00356 [Bacillus amyloliquefaciens LL3]AEK87507.1 hypothetical protein BAXH7_00359 [Bacillus amyloliquefaciens XH7]KYC93000.1 hypothetical protein B425_0357 [Bacillus amyloliquefaciens]QBG54768.1 hypothetical protein D2M30_0403 [Bacillus amyloliquefaciens]